MLSEHWKLKAVELSTDFSWVFFLWLTPRYRYQLQGGWINSLIYLLPDTEDDNVINFKI